VHLHDCFRCWPVKVSIKYIYLCPTRWQRTGARLPYLLLPYLENLADVTERLLTLPDGSIQLGWHICAWITVEAKNIFRLWQLLYWMISNVTDGTVFIDEVLCPSAGKEDLN
jgi:hypothetical protein